MSHNIPTRVQRKRTKGFTLPPNTLCCTRPSKWSNPFRVGEVFNDSVVKFVIDPEFSVILYKKMIEDKIRNAPDALDELLEYDHLACWCRLDEACHVDVIIRHLKELHGVENGN